MRRAPPAAAPSTALITREGFEQLRAEIDRLWRVERPEVVRALSAAAAEGDRSENAEYHYRKKQLGAIDRRVRFLSRRMPALRVIETVPTDRLAAFFGAWVTVERLDAAVGRSSMDVDGEASEPCDRKAPYAPTETDRLRIVGPDEIDGARGYISIDSPLARALLKRHAGDEIVAQLPGGTASFRIIRIEYEPANPL